VLNFIREREPISRAEISHETALQRSTVSLIVDELKTRGLIYEVEGESTGGRPPTLLRLRPAGYSAIGVDVGTAQTTVAVADLVGRVVDKEIFETDRDVTVTFNRVVATIQRFVNAHGNIEGIGVSVPGVVRPAETAQNGIRFRVAERQGHWRRSLSGRRVAATQPILRNQDDPAETIA